MAKDKEPDDTISMEQEPIMETAEFKALVELDAELSSDDESPETAETPAENDDLLSITDQLEKLSVIEDEEDSVFNAYNNGEQA